VNSRVSAVAAACAAVLLTVLPAAADVAAGPSGAAFYTPPSPLPEGKRGSVIWTRPFDGTLALPSAARNILTLYRSTDAQGRIVPVSGTVAIPQGEAPRGGWPVISWAHGTAGGTAGGAPGCAPSRDTAGGPGHDYVTDIRVLLDGFVKTGYAVVATDYQGLGVAGVHPFLQGVSTGRNALDIVRAAREIEPEIGKRYVVMGHSQGGQADLFAAAESASYLPDLKLVGNVAISPPSQIASRLEAVMKSDKVEPALPYLLFMLRSYAAAYPEIDLARILSAAARAHLPELVNGCFTAPLPKGYWATAVARDQFVPHPDIIAVHRVAAANEPGSLRIAAPTLVVQGTADKIAPPRDTLALVRQLCARRNVVVFAGIPGADHEEAMVAGAGLTHDWIDARFTGVSPVVNECGALVSATD